jgi:hypothetical protein
MKANFWPFKLSEKQAFGPLTLRNKSEFFRNESKLLVLQTVAAHAYRKHEG